MVLTVSLDIEISMSKLRRLFVQFELCNDLQTCMYVERAVNNASIVDTYMYRNRIVLRGCQHKNKVFYSVRQNN